MQQDAKFDAWSAGQNYEQYMGRWSRAVARRFVAWLAPPSEADWLEIGCGTGALTSAVLADCEPRSILATDPSEGFVAHARNFVGDGRARFEVASADRLPAPGGWFDIVTSALAFNFIPDRLASLHEMKRVLRPSGMIGFYVWDYPAGGVGFIDEFWKAAAEIDPNAAALDECRRFPFCTQSGLADICREAGLAKAVVEPIEIDTSFPDFEAFWRPFTLGAGPAPGYCTSLPEAERAMLKGRLHEKLGGGRPVNLSARAWAVRAPL